MYNRLGNRADDPRALPEMTSMPPFYELGALEGSDCNCYSDQATDGYTVW